MNSNNVDLIINNNLLLCDILKNLKSTDIYNWCFNYYNVKVSKWYISNKCLTFAFKNNALECFRNI